MTLYTGEPYWDKTVLSPFRFGKVTEAKQTDVLIVGGGISGNLCAYVLSAAGIDVMIVDENRIGKGSSIVNTGLLQYRSDKMLCEFVDDIGEQRGRLFYQMCLEAMDQLTSINDSLGDSAEYRLKDSIYYASAEEDENKLAREYEILTKYGFPVEFLNKNELIKRYQIDKSCALRTWHDADVNPYKFIQALTKKNLQQGVRYFENTHVELESNQGNSILTKEGHAITFKSIVLTTGYAKIYSILKDKIIIRRTYAFCSEPYEKYLWKDDAMIWETKRPYLYFRTTKDRRIIGGGLDDNNTEAEQDEQSILEKAKEIARRIESIYPRLNIDISYCWSALFFGSDDGLPFIGKDPDKSNVYYLLGYEGNGTCYSMAGALIIKDGIVGKSNVYQDIVKVNRI